MARVAASDHSRASIDAVVSHHLDGFRSGVARFNELLAGHLGVPLVGLTKLAAAELRYPLLSLKVRELPRKLAGEIEELIDAGPWPWELFLHEYAGLPLEEKLVRGARRVVCGNAQIESAVREDASDVLTLWTPGLLLDDRVFHPHEISVFSFGMAHKIQTGRFRHLKELLDASASSYAVYISAANHETATMRDAELVFEEMHEIFPDTLYFLGNLSDVAVANQLRQATFFAAFFEGGARANNTSVASAMERGAVVVTNLDRWSPMHPVHMESVIDIDRCDEPPPEPEVRGRIGQRAAELAGEHDWETLVASLQSSA